MVLFVIATVVSILSPFVVCGFAMYLIYRYLPAEKHRYTELALRVVAVILSLGLPGWVMVAFGYLWFSNSMNFLLAGLVLLSLGLWTHTQAEAFIITAILMVLMIHLGLAVNREKEFRDRKKMKAMAAISRLTNGRSPCNSRSGDSKNASPSGSLGTRFRGSFELDLGEHGILKDSGTV